MNRLPAFLLALAPMTGLLAQDHTAVIEWVRANAVPLRTAAAGGDRSDLRPLAKSIGKARIVSLGEATHGTREFFQMKHRLLEYLVEEHGFRAFGIEASYPECVAINDYVLTGKGDGEALLHGQRFWVWDTEEVLALIEWMRRYNADPKHADKVQFVGFDMQFPEAAVRGALAFLADHGVEVADIEGRLAPLLAAPKRRPEQARQPDEATRAAAELLQKFDDEREALVAKASARAWQRARQFAVVASQAEALSRCSAAQGAAARDRAMADNVAWMLEAMGPDGKVVLWAHNGHVSKDPGKWRSVTMGSELDARFGDAHLAVGFVFDGGSFQARDMAAEPKPGQELPLTTFTVGASRAGSVPAVFAKAELPIFFLDLRRAAAAEEVRAWFAAEQLMRTVGSGCIQSRAEQYYVPSVLPKRFDAVIFFASTSRARPNRRTRERFGLAPLDK